MGTQEHWTAAQYQEYLRQRAKGGNKYHAEKYKQMVAHTTAGASASGQRSCNCWNGTDWCATCGSRSLMS